MGEMMTITAEDGVKFNAYEARPDGACKGGVIILQEIFGVNAHIREVCDDYAKAGWHAIAPALFDRVETGIALNYDADGMAAGRSYKSAVDDHAEGDILACLNHLTDDGIKAVIGYCWGGSLAWRMACRYDGIDAAVAYYGGELPALKDEVPRCPVQAHFGATDPTIPMEGVEEFMAAQPNVASYVYEAGHGFNCDHRPQFNADASQQARQHVDKFLAAVR